MLEDTEVGGASRTRSASAQPAQSAGPTTNAATVPADEQTGARSEILRHILQNSEPAPLPDAWTFLRPTNCVRTLRCMPSELVASLKESFSEEELQAAKVLTGDAANQLQLSPVLCEHKFQVLDGADHQPIDLASDSGALFGTDPPCFKYACQRLAVAGRTKRVMVAALEDLQIFESLGLRSTPAAGLASLDGQQVRRLYANLSSSSRPRYQLTFVGASLANLECKLTSYIEPVLKRLDEAQAVFEHYENDLPIELFELWQPSAEDFNRIRTATTFSDREITRRVTRASVEGFALPSSGVWRQLHEPDETDLESALAALIRAIYVGGPHGFGGDLKRATAQLRAAINRLTTRRFRQAAAAALTPQESCAHLLRAEIIEYLNQGYGPLNAATSRDGFSYHIDPTLGEERLEAIGRGINLLLKVERLSPQSDA